MGSDNTLFPGLVGKKARPLKVKEVKQGPDLRYLRRAIGREGYFSWKLLGLKKVNIMEGV